MKISHLLPVPPMRLQSVTNVRGMALLAALLGLAACEDASLRTPPGTGQTPQASPQWRATARGIGPVRVGMTIGEAETAIGAPIAGTASPGECVYVRSSQGPPGVMFMVVDGRIVRVDVTGADVLTDAGARIGDTEARVRELYDAGVSTTPHKYTDGHYLTVAADAEHRLVFETDGQHVTRYHTGRLPEVEWVEGCS